MKWDDALEAANRIDVRTKQTAYELSYRYLDNGPSFMTEREGHLRQEVAMMPSGSDLPAELGRELFAWQNAAYMAQRRLPWDLPPAWSVYEESLAAERPREEDGKPDYG
jgi:hypothetical protein